MIYHVLPGDSLVEEFKKTGLDGEIIVCREAFVAGPIDADTLYEFWEQRARFVLTEYAEELAKLLDVTEDDDVNLWFEYELFCSVNMWFCLLLLKESDATVYRVEPIGLDEENRWDGFGKFMADDLQACFEMRTPLSNEDIALGADLWEADRKKDHGTLKELVNTELPCFPHLKEVVAAAVTQETQPLETLKAIIAGGETDFGEIFVEFKKRAGVYGYGDLQVEKLLEKHRLPFSK